MNYIIASIFIIAVLVWAIVFDGTLPKKYRMRSCTGRNWKKAFPDTPNHEIRKFLLLFTDAFASSSNNKLKFEPEDKIIDIYRELYPSKWMADALEVETLADDIEKEYGVKSNKFWHDNVTLGDIFKVVKNA